jgi:antitoxin HigA-1
VIRSFKDKRTEALFQCETVPQFRPFEKAACRKLDMLDAAFQLADLRSPPGSRLEALRGNREGQYSIRINDQAHLLCLARWRRRRSRDRRLPLKVRIMSRIRTHPGEVLLEEFMKPLGLSANALALALRVPATRIGDIVRTDRPRAVTADTAMRLARYFGTSPEFWLNLQAAHDLSRAVAERGAMIERDVRPRTELSA